MRTGAALLLFFRLMWMLHTIAEHMNSELFLEVILVKGKKEKKKKKKVLLLGNGWWIRV